MPKWDFPKLCQTLQTFIEHNLAKMLESAEDNRSGPLQSCFYEESAKTTKREFSTDICKCKWLTVLAQQREGEN